MTVGVFFLTLGVAFLGIILDELIYHSQFIIFTYVIPLAVVGGILFSSIEKLRKELRERDARAKEGGGPSAKEGGAPSGGTDSDPPGGQDAPPTEPPNN